LFFEGNYFRLGALFTSKVFEEKNKEKIEEIVKQIRLAFEETLTNIKWMDYETRRQAQMKAKMIIGNTTFKLTKLIIS
jgi:predicted metalloendopeptidase